MSKPGLRRRMPEWKKESARRMRRNPMPTEAKLWSRLRARQVAGARFGRQRPLLGYIADFWCPAYGLVVEVDGSSHNGREESDARRDRHLAERGITTLRFTAKEVACEIDRVVRVIEAHIEAEDFAYRTSESKKVYPFKTRPVAAPPMPR